MPDVTAPPAPLRPSVLTSPRPAHRPSGGVPPDEVRVPWSRHRLVASLLDGSCLVADLRAAAACLGLPVDGRYQVVALDGDEPAHRAAARATVAGPGVHVHWHSSRPVEHGVVLLGRATADLPDREHPGPRRLPAGVRLGVGLPVDGLTGLADGRRQAHAALDLCPPGGGRVDLADHLPAALLMADPTLSAQLAAQVLGPLDTTTAAEREVLLETFTAWLEADGSTRGAATRLGCHRNTVTNRIRRFEGLTGRRVERPDDLVELTLAVRARSLEGPSPQELGIT